MHRIQYSKSWLSAIVIGLFALFTFYFPAREVSASLSPTQVGGAAPPDEERLVGPPAKVHLSWEGLGDDGSVLNTRGTTINLNVANRTEEPVTLKLTLNADNGGASDRKQQLGAMRIKAFDSEKTQIDVRRFGFALGTMGFSGRFHVTAEDVGHDAKYAETAISPPIYFHPTNEPRPGAMQNVAFYGKKALRETFAGGDFRGSVRELDPEDRAGLTRIGDLGAGNASASREGEEQLPEEIPGRQGHSAESKSDSPGDVETGPERSAASSSYRTCLMFRSQTIDSGIPIGNGPNKGGVEDYRTDWNAGKDVPAYGIRVKLKKGSWEKTFDAEPNTGCFNWSHESQGQFLLIAYGYATSAQNNYVRVHDDPNSFATYPGHTLAIAYYMTPNPGGTNYGAIGGYDSEWTMMAILSFSLYRMNLLHDKQFHVAIDNAEKGWSSAHWGDSNKHITEGRHCLKMWNWSEDGTNLQTQRKFGVSHEFGHAFAALFYGDHPNAQNGGEPNVRSDLSLLGFGVNFCGEGLDPDTQANSYTIQSQEYNSMGFREGFASFVSAAIWNNQSSEGSFHWLGTHHDLERHGDGVGTTAGGRLENVCCNYGNCQEAWAGNGTNEDWMLFFWDWYTNVSNSCSTRPTIADMLRLYRDTRLGGGLEKNNYYTKMRTAAQGLNLPSCLKNDRFEEYAIFNGINNQ